MRIFFVLLLGCFLPVHSLAQTAVDSTLRVIDSLYNAGSYSAAELESRRMLENPLLSDSLRNAAEQRIAFSLVAQEKPALAREHFLAILRRDPSHELDPILTSPKILAVFNDARATNLAARSQEMDSSLVSRSRTPQGITFRTIVFPGWEQWYHGRTPLGPILVGAGVATLGSGIALAFMRKSAHSDYLAATVPEDIEAKYDTYNKYAKAETACFVAFAAVYVLSEIEVFVHNSPVSISPASPGSPVGGTGLRLSLALP